MKKITFVLIICSMFIGCTDAQQNQFKSYGKRHHVMVYSGGVLIYDGHSTGKVHAEEQSDGWYFTDESTGRLKRVSGHVIIEPVE